MMKNFLEMSKKIKEDDTEVTYCEKCGEPSRIRFVKCVSWLKHNNL